MIVRPRSGEHEASSDVVRAVADARPGDVILEMRGITKVYPPQTRANDGIDFSLTKGEVHALLGENGAGKTTLMNILYGLVQPSEGALYLGGKEVTIGSPKEAMLLGIGMVHQHFKLFETLSVAENIFFGREPGSPLYVPPKKLRDEAAALCQYHKLEVDPAAPIWQLPLGTRQRVELVRVLHRGARILILDEPTAVLTPHETEQLLTLLRSMATQGQSVVFITHKLEEALSVSDRITVLRKGKVVQTLPARDADKRRLARLMVGRDIPLPPKAANDPTGNPVFSVVNLHVAGDRAERAVCGCTFSVRPGEVFALAGVAGNGQRELVEAIIGMRPVISGTVHVAGDEATNKTPRAVRGMGVSLVPEDRTRFGLIQDFTVLENLILGRTKSPRFARYGFLRRRTIEHEATARLEEYDVNPRRPDAPMRTLSGGNQQKVILARELSRPLKVLIANEPTRGLDVGASEYVRTKVMEQKSNGAAVVLVSSDLDEIMALSDRIGVMFRGRLAGTMETVTAELEEIGRLMAGIGDTATDTAQNSPAG